MTDERIYFYLIGGVTAAAIGGAAGVLFESFGFTTYLVTGLAAFLGALAGLKVVRAGRQK